MPQTGTDRRRVGIAKRRLSGRGAQGQQCKITHVQYISEHVIVRNVTEALNQEVPGSEQDSLIRKRLDYGLRVLAE